MSQPPPCEKCGGVGVVRCDLPEPCPHGHTCLGILGGCGGTGFAPSRRRCALEDDGDYRWCRQCLTKPCRWFSGWRPEKEETVGRIHYAPGFYWVRRERDGELEVARLTDEGEWLFSGTEAQDDRCDSEGWGFYWIGERLEPPRNAR